MHQSGTAIEDVEIESKTQMYLEAVISFYNNNKITQL